ncbi:hypothetical protein VZ95_14500 [Elstera litoralis]|uniref:Uncharacterized protein n=1 Tax=Elstera litoralis TaxID=552518 RepID=A0A0F3IQP8_9PROT|nr:hypothetical protein [Elstera litoralis]KJV08947.1 hypothetical protein VZ95_14500 [Elstera litoralis]
MVTDGDVQAAAALVAADVRAWQYQHEIAQTDEQRKTADQELNPDERGKQFEEAIILVVEARERAATRLRSRPSNPRVTIL